MSQCALSTFVSVDQTHGGCQALAVNISVCWDIFLALFGFGGLIFIIQEIKSHIRPLLSHGKFMIKLSAHIQCWDSKEVSHPHCGPVRKFTGEWELNWKIQLRLPLC